MCVCHTLRACVSVSYSMHVAITLARVHKVEVVAVFICLHRLFFFRRPRPTKEQGRGGAVKDARRRRRVLQGDRRARVAARDDGGGAWPLNAFLCKAKGYLYGDHLCGFSLWTLATYKELLFLDSHQGADAISD